MRTIPFEIGNGTLWLMLTDTLVYYTKVNLTDLKSFMESWIKKASKGSSVFSPFDSCPLPPLLSFKIK